MSALDRTAREVERALMQDPVIAGMFRDFAIMNREREAKAAKADPAKHKLSKVMDNTNYRYWPGGTDGRGRSVWFCWSTHRNVAGYFLGWREVRSKTGGKRDQWVARKSRSACEAIAVRRQHAFIDRIEKGKQ